MDATRATLLLRIRDRRDADAWSEFDAIYRPLLFRVARSRGLSEADAEDIVQHCLLATQRAIDALEYDPARGSFRGWLRTLVNNRVRDVMRRPRSVSADTAILGAVPDDSLSPDERFDRIWIEEHLRSGLAWLRSQCDEQTFQAYQRYVISAEDVATVCAELNLSASQLYKIKWRLTHSLREWMRSTCGEECGA